MTSCRAPTRFVGRALLVLTLAVSTSSCTRGSSDELPERPEGPPASHASARLSVDEGGVTGLRRLAPGVALTLPGLFQVQHARSAEGEAVSVAVPPEPERPLDEPYRAWTCLPTSPPFEVSVLYDNPHWVDPGGLRSQFADAPAVEDLSLVAGPSVSVVIRSDGLTRLTYRGAPPPEFTIPVGRGLPNERTVWAAASATLEPIGFLESGIPEPAPWSARIRFQDWVDNQHLLMGQAEIAPCGPEGSLALIEFDDGSLAIAASAPQR